MALGRKEGWNEMRKQSLWMVATVLGMGASAMAAAVVLNDGPTTTAKSTDVRSLGDSTSANRVDVLIDDDRGSKASANIPIVRLDGNTYFEPVIVGIDGTVSVDESGETAGPGERLIYSNTLGTNAAGFPINQLVADEVSTTAPVGCSLTRFKFRVVGKVNPAGVGGGYTVRYSLYNACPQSATSTQRAHYTDEPLPNTGIKIRGSDGEVTFPDETPQEITHVVTLPVGVTVPTNVWLGVSFTRSNCGVVVGAPAEIGSSSDNWDFPGFACNGNLGGFPEQPHASFWLQMYGGANCPASFVGYKASRAAGAQFSAGAQIPFLDDVNLIVNNCQMIGYEVAVRGQGFYRFDLSRDCADPRPDWTNGIPNTYRTFTVNLSTQPQLQLARFSFDPPIPLNAPDVYFRFAVNNSTGGVVLAGVQPSIGTSSENYFLINPQGGCEPQVPPAPLTGVFHASITCGGTQPLGACCDPYLTECAGGPDDGKRCFEDEDCTPPGVCDPVCREVAKINCPYPPRNQDQDPKWQQGQACVPDPFGNFPCGIAACCHLRENPMTHNLDEVCDNLTQRECDIAPPLDKPRLWQLGSYCGISAQQCPRNACLAREGSCTSTHPTPGCNDPFCCTAVCTTHGIDGAFCCDVEWDSVCVGYALIDCNTRPGNDLCAPDPRNNLEGALTIPVPGSAAIDNRNATDTPEESGFCCHSGVGTCVAGTNAGQPCVAQVECPGGFCTDPIPSPGQKGVGSMWFKFTPPNNVTSVSLSTCSSNSPAQDSIMQVFKAGDHSSQENACKTLSIIGCNDNSPGCGSLEGGKNSRICLTNLVPLETYYVQVAAKTANRKGEYRVSISQNCVPSSGVLGNDYCPNAAVVNDGVTPFNINERHCNGGSHDGEKCTENVDCPGGNCPANNHVASFDCPAPICASTSQNDIWFNYTASCSGLVRFDTCGTSPAPDTNLTVYKDCSKCPPVSGLPVGCSTDVFGGCGLGSRVEVTGVQQGECYKVRIADNGGFPISGDLTITCLADDCQPNGVPDPIDIENCPTDDPDCQDCNFNEIPDECDIAAGRDTDCNLNGIPDACELETNDCQPNGIPDDCDIANCQGEEDCIDSNPNNGIPDFCEEPGDCPANSLTGSVPVNCAIDARYPHAPGNPGGLQGWDSIDMTFDGACDVSGAVAGDFSVACTPTAAPCPTVSSVAVNGQTVTVNLSGVIPAQDWTCVTHTPSGDEVCIASLPADTNSDRTSAPADILNLIDHLNGVFVPPMTLNQCDIDRSNLCAPADILSEIDLLNGASGFANWNGKTIPVCPSAP